MKSAKRIGITFFLILSFVLAPFSQHLDELEFSLLTLLTADRPPLDDVVVVGLDDPSFLELGQSPPLPRSLYARALDQLVAQGVMAVGFDLLFSEFSQPVEDQAFVDALVRAGESGVPVVLASADVQVSSASVSDYRQQLVPVFEGALQADVGLSPGSDGVVRRLPVARDHFVTRLALAAGTDHEVPEGARLRYYAPEIPLPYLQFSQVLEADKYLPSEYLDGKLILIGQNTPVSGVDRFPTPFTGPGGETQAGVFLHAQALINRLAGDWIRPLRLPVALAGALLAVFGAGLITSRWRPLKALAVVTAVGLSVMALSVGLFHAGSWLLFWPTVLGLALLYGLDLISNYAVEWKRRLRMRRLFASYVPAAVVDRLIAQPGGPSVGGERRELSILFTDLAGFTRASESVPAEQVASWLNQYLSIMTEAVYAHGGTVDKFIGDAVMAFWNAPLEDPLHASRALACAHEMQQRAAALRKQWASTPFAELQLRVGVHSGEAAVGNLGSNQRFAYTAVGDAVNTAARLEAANKGLGSSVLVSAELRRRLPEPEQRHLAWLGPIRVAGRGIPVEVYTPVDDTDIAELTARLRDQVQEDEAMQVERTLEKLINSQLRQEIGWGERFVSMQTAMAERKAGEALSSVIVEEVGK